MNLEFKTENQRTAIFIILAVWILRTAGTPVTAQTVEAPLTLEGIRLAVQQHNLSLKDQDILFDQLTEELAIRQGEQYPVVSSSAAWGYTSALAEAELPFAMPGSDPVHLTAGTHNRYDMAVVVEQPMFTGHRTAGQIRMVRSQQGAQSVQKTILQNGILLQAGRLYYQMQLNRLQQQALAQAIARTGNRLRIVRSQYAAAQATAFDTLEAANRILQLENQRQTLEHQYPVLVSRLTRLLSLDVLPQISALNVDTLDVTILDENVYQEQALLHRPELEQIDFLRETQQHRIKTIRSSELPQIYASTSWHFARPGVNMFRDEWMGYYTAGLNVHYQLWDRNRTKQQVQKVSLEQERLDVQEQQLRQDIRQQVTEAYHQVLTAAAQITLQRRLVAQERERYRMTQENYQQAHATALDLSTAESTLTESELLVQHYAVAWLEHHLQLHYAAGTIDSALKGR